MKQTMSRRQMLKAMAMGAAGITLAACTPATATQAPTQMVAASDTPAPAMAATATTAPAATATTAPAATATIGLTTVTMPTYRSGEDAGAKFFVPQVDRFNQKYAGKYNIVIEVSPSNTHTDRIKQFALQNKLPPVFQVSDFAWVESYLIANKKLYNLKSWIDQNPDLKKLFIQDSVNFVTKSDGGVYAVPLDVIRPIGLYYDSAMFTPAKNVKDMASWDEFSTALGANKIAYQTTEGGWTISLCLAAIMGTLAGGPDALKAGIATKITDFTPPVWQQAFTILQKSMQTNGWSGAVGAAYPDAATSFYSKKTAVLPDGTWIIDTVNDKTKWSNGFDGTKVVGDYYPGDVSIANPDVYDWMIAANLPQNELDLALAFIAFINTPAEIEAWMLGEGGVAPNLTLSDSYKSQLATKKLLTDFSNKIDTNTKYVPGFSDVVAQSFFTGGFSNLLPNLYNGKSTPAQFSSDLSKAAQQ